MTKLHPPPKILAVIPARAGSKRIPGKNIKDFCGRPLIAWSIQAAASCPVIDRVIVTTDSEEIAEISRHWGAETPFIRPAELANDTLPNDDAILHATEWLDMHQGYRPDFVAALQPTSPLRTSADLEGCWSLLASSGGAECASFCPLSKGENVWQRQPSGQAAKWEGTGGAESTPLYCLNGAIYLISTALLNKERTWLNPGLQAYVMPINRSVDIDTAEDFELAEYYMSKNSRGAV